MNGIAIVITLIILVVIVLSLLIKFTLKSTEVNLKKSLAIDIRERVKLKWNSDKDRQDVFNMLSEVLNDNFNVGKDQLIRSILIIADNNKSKIRSIIDSNYYGDPRDVIMKAMGIEGNNNDHGLSPFQNSKKSNLNVITSRKLDIYSKYLGDVDSFIQSDMEEEKDEITLKEWNMIDNFINELIYLEKGEDDDEYVINLHEAIKNNCFNEHTVDKLKSIASNLNDKY